MFKKFLCAMSIAALLAACGDSDSSASAGDNSGNNGGSGSCNAKPVPGECSFKKECDTWSFNYSTWNITDSYTWVDETTVKYESYMNSYHMDEDDATYENVNRDEFYEKILEECKGLQEAGK